LTFVVPDELSRIIGEAVEQAGVRAIVCRGWSSRKSKNNEVDCSNLSKYKDSILELSSVPHDWLFSKVRGVVHHGGSGTTAAGLRAGVPCVIRPFFGDQFFWGARVQEVYLNFILPSFSPE
jgi:sterol 3beta-glucosyltransferase